MREVQRYSMLWRVLLFVLLCEGLIAAALTESLLLYTRAHVHTGFDAENRGRAATLLAALRRNTDGTITASAGDTPLPPPGDVYEVVDTGGHILFVSPGWPGIPADKLLKPDGSVLKILVAGQKYRGVILHGSRTFTVEHGRTDHLDLLIFNASPTNVVRSYFLRTRTVLLTMDTLLLLSTGLCGFLVLRAGMRPLRQLAQAAGAIREDDIVFTPPEVAMRVSELAPLASTLQRSLQRVEASISHQKNFTSYAAHELKTGITIVQSSVQALLYRERSVPEYIAGLERCLADCNRMEDLAGSLLLLARLEQPLLLLGETVTEFAVFDCVNEVASQLDEAFRKKRQILAIEVEESVLIRMNWEHCYTLLLNLVVNGSRHTPEGSTIHIRVTTDDHGMLFLQIDDNGPGIPPDAITNIFDRFYRGDASRSRSTGGSGLGLAICRALVSAYDGKISVKNMEMGGAVFLAELPVALTSNRAEPTRAAKPLLTPAIPI